MYTKREKIIELYKSGFSALKISETTDIPKSTVLYNLNAAGISVRPTNYYTRKYSIDESIFEKVDKPWKAYFIGFLFGDGSINPDNDAITIRIANYDTHILESFTKIIYPEGRKIYVVQGNDKHWKLANKQYKSSPCARFTINSVKIASDLKKLGLLYNKAFTIDYPNFSEFEADFIRGVFDSDGCVRYQPEKRGRKTVYLMGSKSLMTKINDILSRYNMNFRFYKQKNIYKIETSNFLTIKRFFEFVYYDPNTEFKLTRKFLKMQQIVHNYEDRDLLNCEPNGVSFFLKRNCYIAKYNKRFLGYYSSEEEAKSIYNGYISLIVG